MKARPLALVVALSLLLLTAWAHEGVRRLGFLRYDDEMFVTHNPWVRQGLTVASARWAVTADLSYDSPYADYWAPLTLLSRLVDGELFGARPLGHHLTNLALHAANVLLAFLAFRKLTGEPWPSAFVAAVLAVHPLHVESVAWITERKDVLSLFFWMATLLAYAAWAARPSHARWTLVVLAFAAGLLSKPTVVALPAVLLLIDRWPLRRRERWGALVAEKWPLFVLAAASVAVTVANLRRSLLQEVSLPLGGRLANALHGYVSYLADAFWPARLAVAYPSPGASLGAARLALYAALLAAATLVAVRALRSRPYLATGWGWFAVSLIPAIGVLQSGWGRADRYMYIPLSGLSLAVAWLVVSWARPVPLRRAAAAALAIGAVLSLAVLTRRQVPYWRSDLALFQRAAAVNPEGPIAANGLGAALAAAGDRAGAEREFRRALLLKPDFVGALENLTSLLAAEGRAGEAAAMQERSLAAWAGPGSWARPGTVFTLARVRGQQGRPEEALALYEETLRLDPGHWAALYNSGNLLAAAGRLEEAGARFEAALRGNRDNVDAYRNLGLVRLLQGRVPEALGSFQAGLRVDPANGPLHTALGRALAAAGRAPEARAELREGVRLAPRSGEAYFQLAEALRSSGAADEARAHYREALRLDPSDTRARAALEAP